MNQKELSRILKDHKNWLYGSGGRQANLSDANLMGANLSCADLRFAILEGTNLTNADLSGAILDLSCLPLCCGSLEAHFDDEQLKQIAYHLVFAGLKSKNASEETKKELRKLIDFANTASVIDRYDLKEIKEEGNE